MKYIAQQIFLLDSETRGWLFKEIVKIAYERVKSLINKM